MTTLAKQMLVVLGLISEALEATTVDSGRSFEFLCSLLVVKAATVSVIDFVVFILAGIHYYLLSLNDLVLNIKSGVILHIILFAVANYY